MESAQSLASVSRSKRMALSADLLLVLLLVVAIPLAFIIAHLPFRIDLGAFMSAYWGGTAAQAIFLAVILSVAGLSLGRTLLPMWRSYRQQKLRFLGLILLGIWMLWLFGPWLGLTITIDALALAELLERRKQQFGMALLDVFVPAAYLFVGVLGVYLLNHAIAGIRFAATYDRAFNRADAFLFGTTASQVSRWMSIHLPESFFSMMEFVYRTLYAQIGAGIAITALFEGREYAMRYVRTLLAGYCLALMVFFLWPTIGPFAIRDSPASQYTSFSSTYWMQETIVFKARLLWAHNLMPAVRTVDLADYYIGFPSMHVAMPLIAIWFLRKWRRIALILLAFDFVMLVSIVALEWHYFVDLLGGVLVAASAIFITKERGSPPPLFTESTFREDEIRVDIAAG